MRRTPWARALARELWSPDGLVTVSNAAAVVIAQTWWVRLVFASLLVLWWASAAANLRVWRGVAGMMSAVVDAMSGRTPDIKDLGVTRRPVKVKILHRRS